MFQERGYTIGDGMMGKRFKTVVVMVPTEVEKEIFEVKKDDAVALADKVGWKLALKMANDSRAREYLTEKMNAVADVIPDDTAAFASSTWPDRIRHTLMSVLGALDDGKYIEVVEQLTPGEG
jgi:hypothetical protein